MKLTRTLLAGALAAGASATALAGAPLASAASARAASTTQVQLRHTRVGSILTTSSGLTLYEFTRDRAREDSCVKISGCSKLWPALETSGRVQAGSGVRAALLSTITLRGGAKQITYAGHALYTYAADRPGSTGYVGVSAFGGRWDALNAAGGAVS
jgi:predicted lipoprotein with Yx(FWY)xxD motif